ncbi:coiled-coil-helix-coiled-coil-helix domain-containing protein [Acetobacter pasteurianus]|nr:coiled-coil-helix-coiled-coil-helix domain-containing protein [Acetobacter pasteurianus]
MPRQRRSAPAPRQQTRSAHTATYPQQQQAPPSYPSAHPAQPQTASQGPGLFGQMASTAAGVAVGSTIGHTLGAGITGMFGGGRSEPAPAPAPAQQDVAAYQQQNSFQNQEQARHCDVDARNFTRCLEENDGNMQTCGFYLQQLKACQEAARQY